MKDNFNIDDLLNGTFEAPEKPKKQKPKVPSANEMMGMGFSMNEMMDEINAMDPETIEKLLQNVPPEVMELAEKLKSGLENGSIRIEGLNIQEEESVSSLSPFLDAFIKNPFLNANIAVEKDPISKIPVQNEYALADFGEITIPDFYKDFDFEKAKFKIKSSNEKFVMFETEVEGFETFITVFAVDECGVKFLYVPIFGNNVFTKEEGDFIFPLPLFVEDEVQAPGFDFDKMKAETDFIMFFKEPDSDICVKVKDFGKILFGGLNTPSFSDYYRIGTIMNPDSEKVNQFLKDFNIENERKFPFYLKLTDSRKNAIYTFNTIFENIDFNKNIAVQEAEVFKFNDGIGIRLDLDEFEKN
jgi:hypothetical protein